MGRKKRGGVRAGFPLSESVFFLVLNPSFPPIFPLLQSGTQHPPNPPLPAHPLPRYPPKRVGKRGKREANWANDPPACSARSQASGSGRGRARGPPGAASAPHISGAFAPRFLRLPLRARPVALPTWPGARLIYFLLFLPFLFCSSPFNRALCALASPPASR